MGNCCASPLRAAIRDNDMAALKQTLEDAGDGSGDLIDEDADADCCLDWMDCSRKPKSPLFSAVGKGNIETVEILLNYGADIKLLDYEGHTIMHVASRNNNLKMMKLLHDKNKDLVNMADYDGMYPIHVSCFSIASASSGNIEVLKFIVNDTDFGKSHQNIFVQDKLGKTALDYSQTNKNLQAEEFLKSKLRE